MRPLYETTTDRANQEEVAQMLSAAWGLTLHRTPKQYPFDYVVCGDRSSVPVEIKCRTETRFGGPKFFIISASKFLHARQWYDTFGGRARFVFRFSDGEVASFRYDPSVNYPLLFSGRRDRGDAQDLEPVVAVLPDQFAFIGRL